MSVTERRQVIRFDLKLFVTVRWKNGAEMREAETVCKNVSSRGIYFYLPERIKSGADIAVEITLPKQITLARAVRVRCWGRILRCELGEGANAGIAAALEKYEFVASNDANIEENDSRKSPRYKLEGLLGIELDELGLKGSVTDIGREGLFIEISSPLLVGAVFTAQLALEEQVQLSCLVQRVEPGHGMGVSIFLTSRESLKRFAGFLDTLPHQFRTSPPRDQARSGRRAYRSHADRQT